MQISRVLHAGYIFEADETRLIFDPIFENPFSRNCYAFPKIQFDLDQIQQQKFDAVFISHFHDDHCSLESLDLIDRRTPIYIYCLFEEIISLIEKMGFTVHPLQINQSVNIGNFKVIPRRALDADVDSIFHIQIHDLNILNVVDSWIGPETMAILQETNWDMILWPFQTMRELEVLSPSRASADIPTLPVEWKEQLQALNPKHLIPSSCQFIHEGWSWYNQALFPISYRQFTQEMKSLLPEANVIRLNPGTSVLLTVDSAQVAPPLQWIIPIGPQDVDYKYQHLKKAPPTADIAKNFVALNSEQSKKVLQYCQAGLIEAYNCLESSADNYFDGGKIWKLSVFDHQGEARHFHYQFIHEKMVLVPSPESLSIAWSTEVPLSKLYAALEQGESLTSMYLRINEMVFVDDVDLIEDPLIRCLFHNSVATYQAAQFEKLRATPIKKDT